MSSLSFHVCLRELSQRPNGSNRPTALKDSFCGINVLETYDLLKKLRQGETVRKRESEASVLF